MNEHPVPKCPTPEECSANARLPDVWGLPAFACWYPQMGGYVGRAVIILESNTCFGVYVWHDGAFPFDGDSREGGAKPAFLHHCNPDQFIEFGTLVGRLQEENPQCPKADPEWIGYDSTTVGYDSSEPSAG